MTTGLLIWLISLFTGILANAQDVSNPYDATWRAVRRRKRRLATDGRFEERAGIHRRGSRCTGGVHSCDKARGE
jgi:hypothetical protein